jgi:hypothetical protein
VSSASPLVDGSVDHVLTSHVFSAVRLGAKFGDEPHPEYSRATARAIVADLAEHGHHLVGPPARQDTLTGLLRILFLEHAERPYLTYSAMADRMGEIIDGRGFLLVEKPKGDDR